MRWNSAVLAALLLLVSVQGAVALDAYEAATSWATVNQTPTGVAAGPNGLVYAVGGLYTVDHWLASWNADGSGRSLLYGSRYLGEPQDIAVNATGYIYVTDAEFSELPSAIRAGDAHGTDRNGPRAGVMVFDPQGHWVRHWLGWNDGTDHSFNDKNLAGIGIGPDGDVYVVYFDSGGSNSCVLRFAPDGTFRAKYGSSGTGEGQFTHPRDVAVGGTAGQPIVYVNDILQNEQYRIARFEPAAGGTITGWTSWMHQGAGFADYTCIGPSGDLFVVDSGAIVTIQNPDRTDGTDIAPVMYRVYRYSPSGALLETFGSSGTNEWGYGVASDASGSIYVSTRIHMPQVRTDGTDSIATEGRITKFRPPSTGGTFAAYPESGTAPLYVLFLDYTRNGRTWTWDFGDGGTSDLQFVTHLYNRSGLYTVSVTVTDWAGQTVTKTMHHLIRVSDPVTPAPTPVADFSANTTTGPAPLAVQFTDGSGKAPYHWWWQFGDGASSTERDPVHTYERTGAYTVNLTVWTSLGTATVSKPAFIIVDRDPRVPEANFTMSRSSGKAPLYVRFTDTSTGNPTSWRWDFGGTFWTTTRSPTVIFWQPGTYPVTLTVRNAYGWSSMGTNVTVTGAATRPAKGDAVSIVG
jgi:PKD repeat protein